MNNVPVIADPAAMSVWSEAARGKGEKIALVPTMGALHRGHLSLLAEARRRAQRVVLSIFVNPMQFGPQEDLAKYPRDLAGDLAKAASVGCDLAFVPEAASMYGPGFQTAIDVREVSQGLCGARRPGHFVGVATVVCKLFNVVRPHLAFFGEKDFQQLAVIRRMVTDLNMPVEIVGLPTVREPDGLALSSRNAYLSPSDRQRATALYAGLSAAKALAEKGERRASVLLEVATTEIAGRVDRIDYLEIRVADDLKPLAAIDQPAVMLVAAFVGGNRLIDNLRFG
ncbi:MAG TPA: pantoate--beta-alanine ligase [Polyangia bacterium]|nr:pantoate--beta-alanine ligase [Polyangia bacterium]